MACSPAQLESNRRNALKSTGPRTPEGKARSRANSLKHGLTGAGVVLPTEDAQELDRRFDALEAEMNPRSEAARQLLRRFALMTVKLDRCAVHEARATAHRMRHAVAEFDDARLAEAEKLHSWIAAEPATNARRLRGTPEGIDRLIVAIEGLRSDLDAPDGVRWSWQHCDQFHHLIGLRREDMPVSRPRALTEAIAGDFRHLRPADRPELTPLDRQCWAAGRLLALLEEEIAALKRLREGLDLEGLELDRAEAPERALFDSSKDAVLARKYEAANERTLFRSLREFRQAQAEAPEVAFEPRLAAEPAGELGSRFPEAPEAEVEEASVDALPVEVVPPAVEGGGEDSSGGTAPSIPPALGSSIYHSGAGNDPAESPSLPARWPSAPDDSSRAGLAFPLAAKCLR